MEICWVIRGLKILFICLFIYVHNLFWHYDISYLDKIRLWLVFGNTRPYHIHRFLWVWSTINTQRTSLAHSTIVCELRCYILLWSNYIFKYMWIYLRSGVKRSWFLHILITSNFLSGTQFQLFYMMIIYLLLHNHRYQQWSNIFKKQNKTSTFHNKIQ